MGKKKTDDKAEVSFISCEEEYDCEFFYKYEITYKGTIYLFAQSTRAGYEKHWYERGLENVIADIARDIEHSQCSETLRDALQSRFLTVQTSPKTKYYKRVKPPKGRDAPLGNIAHLLNAALHTYLMEKKDTPDEEKLWEWINEYLPLVREYKVRHHSENTIAYTAIGHETINRESYGTAFRRRIGTKSYAKESAEEMKKFYAKQEKKPVGRPRKNTQSLDM